MVASRRNPPLKPRKTPRQSRSSETVLVVIEAAARVLEQRGFAGYTTNAVADAAGVSIGSLYQYFPGKDALTAALIERETTCLLADVAAAPIAMTGREGLMEIVRAAVAHQMRRPALARLLDFEERRLPLDQQNGSVSDRLTHAILHQLSRLPDEGILNLEEAATDILAIVKGMVDAAGERGETAPSPLEERVGRAVFGYLGLSSANRHL